MLDMSRFRVSFGLASLWAALILVHLATDWLPASPYGRHPGYDVPALHVATAPLFIYRAKSTVLALFVQVMSLFSPLRFGKTTGELTAVTFSLWGALESLLTLAGLMLLEYLYKQVHYGESKLSLKFVCNILGISIGIYAIRTGLGFASFHLGLITMPSLYFADGVREVSKGLWPTLITFYLLIQTRLTTDVNFTVQLVKGHSVSISDLFFVVACLPFCRTLWWNVTGIVLGLTAALIYQPRINAYLPSPTTTTAVPMASITRTKASMATKAAILFLATALYYWIALPSAYKTGQLSISIPGKEPVVTFIIMTAPRRTDTLTETVQSYLDALPSDPEDPLADRIKFVVFTHFTVNAQFDAGRERFEKEEKARHYFEWVRFPGNEINQKKHFDAAIRHVAEQLHPKSHYIGVIEDDFPLCPGEWNEVLRLIRDANKEVPHHCGIFIGTGGSGLIIRRNKVEAALISMHGADPTDVGLQNCLRGKTCAGCQVVIPSRILMRHSGHDSSTLGHWYSSEKYQCRSRHPFVGDLDAVLL